MVISFDNYRGVSYEENESEYPVEVANKAVRNTHFNMKERSRTETKIRSKLLIDDK